jgi:Glu-tRNA(Gln) amidotransferase subunit E-like FAD-binding protein
LKINAHIISQLADGLSRHLIIFEQIDSLTKVFDKEPHLSIEEALEKLHVRHFTEKELNALILKKLNIFDVSRARFDEAYRRIVVPKAVGEVLKAANRSVSGELVAEKIRALIDKERI